MTDKQYRLKMKNNPQGWTGWQPHQPTASFSIDLDRYDAVEWRDTPQACTAVAPFEVECIGRPRCERLDAKECVSDGTHLYEVEIEDYDCYHTRQITWSAL